VKGTVKAELNGTWE